jgi:hypothetical protein
MILSPATPIGLLESNSPDPVTVNSAAWAGPQMTSRIAKAETKRRKYRDSFIICPPLDEFQ